MHVIQSINYPMLDGRQNNLIKNIQHPNIVWKAMKLLLFSIVHIIWRYTLLEHTDQETDTTRNYGLRVAHIGQLYWSYPILKKHAAIPRKCVVKVTKTSDIRELTVEWLSYRTDWTVGQASLFLTPQKEFWWQKREITGFCWCVRRLKHVCKGQEKKKVFWISYHWTPVTQKQFFEFGEYGKLASTKILSVRQ